MQSGADTVTWTGWEALEPFVREFIERRCRDRSAVDDLVQETPMRIASRRGRLGETHSLRGWAVRIAQNLMRDRLRCRGRQLAQEAPDGNLDQLGSRAREGDEAPEPATFVLGSFEFDSATALRHVERALATLGADDRKLIVAFYRGRRGSLRAAAECAVPPQRVKLRLFRARQRLRRALLRQLVRDRGPAAVVRARVEGEEHARQLATASGAERGTC